MVSNVFRVSVGGVLRDVQIIDGVVLVYSISTGELVSEHRAKDCELNVKK